MKVVFTGGGTGGHFYPLIAIREAIGDLVKEQHLLEPELFYFAPEPFDERALFENGITFVQVPAGKLRRYFSLKNITDWFLTGVGLVRALFSLFRIYPDVVISKGGYGSMPTVLAAWILRIPIIIHESDAKPGRANLFASKFATHIAIAYDSAAEYFPKQAQDKIARTGIPVRKALMRTEKEGARQYLKLEEGVPTLFILGGSQGSMKINEMVLSALPELVALANIIHQTGTANIAGVEAVSSVILAKSPHTSRYHPIGYLDQVSMQRAAAVADLVISRAGSSSISEIALWQTPAIIIPIPESVSHDQRTNAYSYARTGAAIVIEEENLTPHLFVAEVTRLLKDETLRTRMASAAKGFTDTDAARILATQALTIALSHT